MAVTSESSAHAERTESENRMESVEIIKIPPGGEGLAPQSVEMVAVTLIMLCSTGSKEKRI